MDIREQLAREMADSVAPPVGSLVADAIDSGVRARRRRYGLFGGATAAFAVVAVVGVTALVHGAAGTTAAGIAQPGASRGIVASSPSAPAASAVASLPAQPPPSAKSSPSAAVFAPGKPVVTLLERLVARHGHFTEVSYDQGSVLYDDGHGAATISALVTNAPQQYGSGVPGMDCPGAVSGFTCRISHLPNGVVARITTSGPYVGGCAEAKCAIEDRRVEIRRTDGTYVAVDAYNGPFGHDRQATRTHTILDTDQLIAIATNPQWSLTMA